MRLQLPPYLAGVHLQRKHRFTVRQELLLPAVGGTGRDVKEMPRHIECRRGPDGCAGGPEDRSTALLRADLRRCLWNRVEPPDFSARVGVQANDAAPERIAVVSGVEPDGRLFER